MKTLMLSAVVAALLHITPTVVLEKRTDAVARLIPGGDAFAARAVRLSDADAHKLHQAVDWSPDDDIVTFYIGRRAGALVGALLFVRVDSPHGPVEVAVGFAPDGAVGGVAVTKATVESKNWIQAALAAGLTAGYRGIKPGDAPAGALAIKDRVGALPFYMAQQVDKGVARALAAYGMFYR